MRFKKFLEESEEIDKRVEREAHKKGYRIGPAYHGSDDADIVEFEHGHTAYGIFFTPDEDTASFYQSKKGGRVYRVFLKSEKELDITEDGERYKAFRDCFGGYSESYWITDEGEKIGDRYTAKFLMRHIKRGKLETIKQIFPNIDEDAEGIIPEEELDESMIYEYIHYEDPDDEIIVKLMKTLEPDIRIYEEYEDVKAAIEAYGSQEFYMEYQDDLMKWAVGQGYDMVVFDDPSSTGQGISYVVFKAEQIKLADTTTYDDDNKPIPLSSRFDTGNADIRY